MKILLLIVLLSIAFYSNAQYSKEYNPPKGWGSPELYIPTTVLASTFAVNQALGGNITLKQRSTIAATGIATSVLTHFVFRKIRTSRNKNRLCESKILRNFT